MSNPPKIFGRIRGLRKEFGGSLALDGIDLDLPAGELTVILGPSGCGKTTLLRILAGLAPADAGKVEFDGVVVNDPRSRLPSEKRRLGMVFQDALLWPHLRVRGNIAFPLGAGRTGDPRVVKAARAAEIEPFLDRYPSELSGGECRRVAIARAVVSEPRLLLMDEPLSGLDANLRVRLIETIRRIQQELGVTALYVTHDQDEALGLADRVVVMRSGRVLQVGTAQDIYLRPKTEFVADFVGVSTIVPALAENGRARCAFGAFPVPEGTVGTVRLVFRPERVRLDGPAGIPGRVLRSAFRGDRWLVTVTAAEREILARSSTRRPQGEEVTVSFAEDPVVVEEDEA